jgi:hypothetical protein
MQQIALDEFSVQELALELAGSQRVKPRLGLDLFDPGTRVPGLGILALAGRQMAAPRARLPWPMLYHLLLWV